MNLLYFDDKNEIIFLRSDCNQICLLIENRVLEVSAIILMQVINLIEMSHQEIREDGVMFVILSRSAFRYD